MITRAELQDIYGRMKADDRTPDDRTPGDRTPDDRTPGDGTMGEPPSVDELLAYSLGELSQPHREQIARRLGDYPELARALEVPFRDDDPQPGEPGYLSELQIAAQWRAMRDSLRRAAWLETAPTRRWRRAALASVATLVLSFGGIAWQAQQASRVSARVELPRIVPEDQLLLPDDGRRGLPGDSAPTLTARGDSYMLVVPLLGDARFDGYRMELAPSGALARPIWRSGTLAPRSNDTFAILVPHAFLAPGQYQLALYGVPLGGREAPIATYTMRVPG